MTDVNIATSLLGDAQDDAFDVAMVLSADSDLSSPVEAVLTRYPKKRVVVVFPPERRSDRLRRVASATFTVGRKVLKDSQLPENVRGSHVFGQVARVYSRGKRRHGNGSKKAQIFVRIQEEGGA